MADFEGTPGNDQYFGTPEPDEIGGGDAPDHLDGGIGDDRLVALTHGGVLVGGPGDDTFEYTGGEIVDFTKGEDTIELAFPDADVSAADLNNCCATARGTSWTSACSVRGSRTLGTAAGLASRRTGRCCSPQAHYRHRPRRCRGCAWLAGRFLPAPVNPVG